MPPDQKFAEPAYGSCRAVDLPQLDLKGGAGVVLAGRCGCAEGPMCIATLTTLIHARIDADADTAMALEPADELGSMCRR